MRRFLATLLLAIAASAANATTTTKNVAISVTHAGGLAQTMLGTAPNQTYFATNPPFQFVAGTGSHGAVLGTLVGCTIFQPTPACAATYSLGGADVSKFAINGSTGSISVGGSDIVCSPSPSLFHLTVTMTQAGVIGSPLSTPITLQCIDPSDTSTLFLAVDNYYPTAGSTVNVTVKNDPNAVFTTGGVNYYDNVGIGLQHPMSYSSYEDAAYFKSTGGAGVHNATIALTVPAPTTDNYQFLRVMLRNSGQGQSVTKFATPLLVSPPTASYVVPTATNTLPPPSMPTPTTTLTVCPSGCNYTSPSAAYVGLSNSNSNNSLNSAKITVSAGAYKDCVETGNADPDTLPPNESGLVGGWHLPPNIWMPGVGGGLARVEGLVDLNVNCTGKGLFVWWGRTTTDNITIDNMEFADLFPNGPSGCIYGGTGNMTLRNVYIHNCEFGIITGNNGPSFTGIWNYTLTNVNCTHSGGGAGPDHCGYFGDGALQLNVDHSYFGATMIGHDLKTRANHNAITCNQFLTNEGTHFQGTLTYDDAEGRDTPVTNNTFVTGPRGGTNHDQANQNLVGYADDQESGGPSSNPGIAFGFNFANNYFVNDTTSGNNIVDWGFYLPPAGASGQSNPPGPMSGNTFVAIPYPYYSYKFNQPNGYPSTTEVNETGTVHFATRAAAGFPATGAPYPPGCSGTIGLMAVP